MSDTDPTSRHLPDATQKITPDDAPCDQAPNPKRRFNSPELLLEDATLSDQEKLALLQEWQLEIDNRLKAEEEGMSASDPISDRKEARLADEEASIRRCITDLAERIGQSE